MAVLFTVWGIAVAFKAINCLRSNETYVFGMWDGGMLRQGKRLNKMGMQIKAVVGVLMAGACIGLFTGLMPIMTAVYTLAFVGVLSLVSDLVTAE